MNYTKNDTSPPRDTHVVVPAGPWFVFIQQQECSMEVNISLEDLFGDSIRDAGAG
jgi:hypothetical protein